jgi:hypothetical protein
MKHEFSPQIFEKYSNTKFYENPSNWSGLSDRQLDMYKGKGKAVPLQAWSGPEGSRKLRFPDFLTTAHDGGKVVSHTHRTHLPPENTPGTHFC